MIFDRRTFGGMLGATVVAATARAAEARLTSTGVLRAGFLSTNPVQAVLDADTGDWRGVAVDLGLGLAGREDARLELVPLQGVQTVIDALGSGWIDIGFIAPDASRAGVVVFSQPYLLNPQALIAAPNSDVTSVDDLKRPGVRIGVTKGDSIALWLTRNRPEAVLVEIADASIAETQRLLASGQIDAFAGNRLRLRQAAEGAAGAKLLPGMIMGVPQAIAVSAKAPQRLAVIDRFIAEARASGALAGWIEKSGTGAEIALPPAT